MKKSERAGEKAAKKLLLEAVDLRWEFHERRQVFTLAEYRAALGKAHPEWSDESLDKVAMRIDKVSTGDDWDNDPYGLKGEYRLANGRRIAKRYALLEHAEEALALSEERVKTLQQMRNN